MNKVKRNEKFVQGWALLEIAYLLASWKLEFPW
jgi:hypothetical protein